MYVYGFYHSMLLVVVVMGWLWCFCWPEHAVEQTVDDMRRQDSLVMSRYTVMQLTFSSAPLMPGRLLSLANVICLPCDFISNLSFFLSWLNFLCYRNINHNPATSKSDGKSSCRWWMEALMNSMPRTPNNHVKVPPLQQWNYSSVPRADPGFQVSGGAAAASYLK